jgi:metallo-beta-lactamase class B
MFKHGLFLGLIFLFSGCRSTQLSDQGITSDDIIIQKLSDHVYQHITFLQTQDFGKVSCNGMVVFDKGEAVVFDTPGDDASSAKLIDWIENKLHCKVKAVVATHFHMDCVGGLAEFHKRGIPSYANHPTIVSAKSRNFPVPQQGFDKDIDLKVGNKKVIAEFFGEGHTRDNVIGYFPDEKIMFGGCLIKEVKAGKGNLEDANVKAWSETVTKLKNKYPEVQKVIPGHGKTGGTELLDYTVKLFEGN